MNFEQLQRRAAIIRGGACTTRPRQAQQEYKSKNKGVHFCNVTACQKPLAARWWNLSTCAFYCPECAAKINKAPGTADDCMRLFGIPVLLIREGSPEYVARFP
jgi:hypothetical protein